MTKISENHEDLRHSMCEVGWTLQNVTLNNHSKFWKANKLNCSWYIEFVNSPSFDFDKNVAFFNKAISFACMSISRKWLFKAHRVVWIFSSWYPDFSIRMTNLVFILRLVGTSCNIRMVYNSNSCNNKKESTTYLIFWLSHVFLWRFRRRL